MTAPIRPRSRDPITADEYRALLAEGLSRDEINAEFVVAPTTTRAAAPAPRFDPDAMLADLTKKTVAGARLATNSAAFNFGDRARAALRAMSPSTTYANALREEQGATAAARETLGPGGTLAAELGGSLVGPGVSAAKLAAKIPAATRGAQLLKQIGTATASGAIAGGLSGAGASDAGDMMGGAKRGAATGALLGGAIGVVAPAGRAVGRYFGAKQETTAREKAAEALQNAAKLAGFDDVESYLAKRVRPGASGRRVIDFDREMQELGLDAARASHKAEKTLEEMAEGRKAVQNTAIAGDVRDALGAADLPAEKARQSTMALVKKREAPLYDLLFKRYPDPIQQGDMVAAWTDARAELPKYIRALRKNAKLSQQSLDELMQGEAPTLQGAHRLKSAMGRAVRVLEKKKASNTLGSDEAQELFALGNFQARLEQAIANAPGGAEYGMIQDIGARGRAVRDAITKGEKALTEDPFVVQQDLNKALGSIGGDPAVRGYRQGAASAFTQRAKDATAGAKELLNDVTATPGVQERMRTLATVPAKADQFAAKMRDRALMAETDAQQIGRATAPREILPGARARSTALQFGESGGWGNLLAGQSPGPGFKLAAGATIAKLLQGRRGEATSRAADLLADLLQRAGDDPEAADQFRTIAAFLQKVNRSRTAAQAGLAAGSASYLGANRP